MSQQQSNPLAVQMKKLSVFLETRKERLKELLPGTMSPDRMLKIALAAASRNPRLLQCSPESFYVALHTSAQLGLEANGPLGHAYLVPYKNKNGAMEAQFQIGYRGLIALARNSGQISTIYAEVVYKGDQFSYQLGDDPKIVHLRQPGPQTDKEVLYVYAVAKLKDGETQRDVMTREQVERIRQRSKAKDNGPWITDWQEMAKKTVVKRLCKYLPLTIKVADVLARDPDNDENEETPVIETAEVLAEASADPVREKLKQAAKPAAAETEDPKEPELANADAETGEISDDLAIDENAIPDSTNEVQAEADAVAAAAVAEENQKEAAPQDEFEQMPAAPAQTQAPKRGRPRKADPAAQAAPAAAPAQTEPAAAKSAPAAKTPAATSGPSGQHELWEGHIAKVLPIGNGVIKIVSDHNDNFYTTSQGIITAANAYVANKKLVEIKSYKKDGRDIVLQISPLE